MANRWAWAVAAAIALILLVSIRQLDWPLFRRLQAQGLSTDGWVTGKGLGSSKDIHYNFKAGERLYGGMGRAGFGNPDFEALAVGDRVVVFYLAQDPAVSALGDPKEHLRSQNRFLAFGMLAFAGVLAWAVSRELKHFSN